MARTITVTLSLILIAPRIAAPQHGPHGPPDPPGPEAPTGSTCPGSILETDHFRWTLDGEGRSRGFVDRRSGKDILDPEGPPFATISRAGRTAAPISLESASLERPGDRLLLSFAEPAARLEIAVRREPSYVVLEIASASDPAIDEVSFGAVRLALPGRASGISGIVFGDDFAASARALDLRVSLRLQGGPRPVLQPVASARGGIAGGGVAGARAAIVGAPGGAIREILQEVVLREGLPSSPLGGPFALDAEENRGSYVFAAVSEANVEEWIALAKKAGLAQIHLIGWERSLGHYEPRPDLFPNGLEGLRAVVAKIHSAGLRAGMHTLTGGIARNDPFVTPIPDPRLAKDGRFTLAADVGAGAGHGGGGGGRGDGRGGGDDAADTVVPIVEPPGDLETSWQYSGRSNVVQIGEELIQYTRLSKGPPHALEGCIRGAFGTRRAAHRKGAAVHHLFAIYGTFQPDETSTLVDDVAERIAHTFNACGFDMIYQDGAEGMPGGPYGWARMREAVFRRLRGRVLVEASEWGYLSWPYHSRIGAYDHPNWGLKRFVDVHCADAEGYRASSLLACQLGWWAILGPGEDHRGELPDEVEYLCTKALAFDMPLSFQGIDVGRSPPNARQDEYLETIGRYERLRLARAVPEEVLATLRTPREEFHLEEGPDGGWRFVPTEYLEHKVTGVRGSGVSESGEAGDEAIPAEQARTDDGAGSWTVVNRHGPQPLRLRIEALYAAAPHESGEAETLVSFGEGGAAASPAGEDPRPAAAAMSPAGAAHGVEATWERSDAKTPAGEAAALLRARNGLTTRRGAWASFRKDLEPERDLARHGALGVWIHGDGGGGIVNFQLTNPSRFWPTWDEHYVDVDFQGWRHVALLFRERDAGRFVDHVWPYGGTSAVFRSPLIRSHVSSLAVYANELPPGVESRILIGPVKALPVAKVRLADPAIEVNGARLVFPVTLQSDGYLELGGDGIALHRDGRGALLGSVEPRGRVPVLAAGTNCLRFTCRGPEGIRARARVTVIVRGEPLLVPAAH